MIDTLIVLAKEPRAGYAKTRLTPPLSAESAALIAAACLQDTLDAVTRTPARRRVLAFAGRADAWAAPGWDVIEQGQGGLDERISAAFEAVAEHDRPVSALLVGMDTPQLRPQQLMSFDPDRHEAALGLARDGGYWALGLRDARRAREVVSGVPMSTATTGAHQYARLQAAGLVVTLLDPLVDVDTVADLDVVRADAPTGRFGKAVTQLAPHLIGRTV